MMMMIVVAPPICCGFYFMSFDWMVGLWIGLSNGIILLFALLLPMQFHVLFRQFQKIRQPAGSRSESFD